MARRSNRRLPPGSGAVWRQALPPNEYFAKHGRRVICSACHTWQRTDPKLHADGMRLREMPCVRMARDGCTGRLRTLTWWNLHLKAMELTNKPKGEQVDITDHEALVDITVESWRQHALEAVFEDEGYHSLECNRYG